MDMELIVLGSGTSHGIPMVGCACAVCRSTHSRDRRLRSSLYVKGNGGERIIVDTGPEFRLQAIRAGMDRLDAILLTHAHADHVHGMDDIRPLSRHGEIPVYGNGATIGELKERFSYIFKETQMGGGKPRLEPRIAEAQLQIGALTITPVPVVHGALPILGWVFQEGNFRAAYITDASRVPESSRSMAAAVDILILGALRRRPHETHFNFDQAIELSRAIGAKRTYLTHLCHDHSHRDIQAYCKAFKTIHPAYDGLTLRGGTANS